MIRNSRQLSSTDDAVNHYKKHRAATFAEIWESIHTGEKSLHAKVRLEPEEILISFSAKEYKDEPDRYSVQVDVTKHIILDPEYLQYINHSCRPNVFFDMQAMSIICIKPIAVDDELTFFYPSTEWSMSQQFHCKCGSSDCIGYVQGASYLPSDILRRYRLSDFVDFMSQKDNCEGQTLKSTSTGR